MSIRTALETATEVTLASAVSSFAFPASASDGVAINLDGGTSPLTTAGAWKYNTAGHADVGIFLTSSAAMLLSGALGVYGYRTSTAKWYLLGLLNGGAAISTLGAATGFSQVINYLGVYDRIAVGPLTSTAVTPSTGTVTITAAQIRQVTDL